jgi:hypothetical protein
MIGNRYTTTIDAGTRANRCGRSRLTLLAGR